MPRSIRFAGLAWLVTIALTALPAAAQPLPPLGAPGGDLVLPGTDPKKPAAEPEPTLPGLAPAAEPVKPAAPVKMAAPVAQPAAATGTGLGAGLNSGAEASFNSGLGQEPGNPTGRQEPAVSLEWIGPAAAKVNQPAEYGLLVRNVCNIAVQKVIVQVRVPQGIGIQGTEPKAEAQDNVLMWEVGTLLPKQEKRLGMALVSPAKGDVTCQAWVTFTGSSVMRMMVREPKLLLKATAPEKMLVGDPANFVLTVSNPGDHPAEQVKIVATLSEGLEHARGNKVLYDIGNLAAGETRSVQVLCVTKAGGTQSCDVTADAEGGLKCVDKVAVNVIMPRLDLEVVGPKLRYLDRKAVYAFKVTNPGDAAASNVVISDVLPDGFKFVQADNGGRHDFSSRVVSWFVGEIGPGQSREVKMEVIAINPGEHTHKASAMASRGLKVDQDWVTRVEGVSAILMEVVDVEDPVEVGSGTSYEIRVNNTGSKTETDVKLVCSVPPQMEFKSAEGPVRFQQVGTEVVFEPLAKLAPRAEAVYRIHAVARTKGDARFKTQLTSTSLVEPVIKQESTRIYED